MTRDKTGVFKPGRPAESGAGVRKTSWKPGNMLAPVPVVLVSCGGTQGWKPNLITIAWIGSVCSDPPMLSIAVRPDRYSHDIIKTTAEFVVNVPSMDQARTTDWCGVVRSQRGQVRQHRTDTGSRPESFLPDRHGMPAQHRMSHPQKAGVGFPHLFLAEVVAVQVSSQLVDARTGFALFNRFIPSNGRLTIANPTKHFHNLLFAIIMFIPFAYVTSLIIRQLKLRFAARRLIACAAFILPPLLLEIVLQHAAQRTFDVHNMLLPIVLMIGTAGLVAFSNVGKRSNTN